MSRMGKKFLLTAVLLLLAFMLLLDISFSQETTTTTLLNVTNETTTTTTVPNTTTTTTTLPDTTPPTVGSVSPTSAILGQSVTFSATVSDNTAVSNCSAFIDSVEYKASITASTTTYTLSSGLTEGIHKAYFKCWDSAGNIGNGTETIVTSEKDQLTATLTLPKETYYPTDTFEPRVKVTDSTGKIIIGATVTGALTYGTGSTTIYFFYSTLCDCYKAWYYFSESTLPSSYKLNVTAVHSSYKSAVSEKTFSVLKPTLNMKMATDKTEYYPGDSITLTIEFTDNVGNFVNPSSVSGDIRNAATGELVSLIYPWRKSDGNYYYTYYLSTQDVDKNYKINVTAKWKEQVAASTATITVTKRGLNADIVLEKNVLIPGDNIQGKINVFDKDGNRIQDREQSGIGQLNNLC